MNNKVFSYISYWGTEFFSDSCDFKSFLEVKNVPSGGLDLYSRYSRDLAEMIGYHATNILPELNGFQGYDTIRFKFRS